MACLEPPELGGNGSTSGKSGPGRAGVTVVFRYDWCFLGEMRDR